MKTAAELIVLRRFWRSIRESNPGTSLPAYRILIRWQHPRIAYRNMVSIYVQPTSFTIDKYPAPDKERAQLLWVAHMNGLKAQAEEVVGREIMYAERNNDSSCLSIQT